ncbi:ABC transporter substrate-binding protein [Shewanella litorisediminis]|uniref:ABC transporter substrate-binding protein n=1 Tax=Shewanella litorisediminis TaxID=1173586 RepID=A0ABX7G2G4_9GAMM|nr:ABC transporter substrate-binding protein [Shewanella litorisediminis]QRH01499.1 ABC transporter substrate-binding protein [Shewanella litorisediminis]
MRLLFILGFWLIFSPSYAKTPVLFLNPGYSSESFWGDVDSLLEASAARLDMQVETLHSDRNHFHMIRQATEVAGRATLPAFVLMVNEKHGGLRMLDAFYRKPVYIQFILNDISLEERQNLLKDPHWRTYLLPAVVPDNQDVGTLTATALVKKLGQQPAQLVLISGDKTTPASVERTQGALAVFQAESDVTVEQTVYGQWQEDKAYQQAQVLLQRYPSLNAVWTANDHMAFGVIRALKEKQLTPGKDVLLSTINTSPQVLALRRAGEINALGGGHFLVAGVALANIRQFRDTGQYPEVHISLFRLLEPDTPLFDALEKRDWAGLLDLVLDPTRIPGSL